MSKETRNAGLSFLLSLLIVAAVSLGARTFYANSKVEAANAIVCQTAN